MCARHARTSINAHLSRHALQLVTHAATRVQQISTSRLARVFLIPARHAAARVLLASTSFRAATSCRIVFAAPVRLFLNAEFPRRARPQQTAAARAVCLDTLFAPVWMLRRPLKMHAHHVRQLAFLASLKSRHAAI